MLRAYQRLVLSVLLAGLVFVAATPASASSISAGQSGVNPTGYLDPNNGNLNFLGIFGPQLFTFGPPGIQVTVEYTLFVVRDPFNPGLFLCGTNCVDFGVDATIISGPAGATTLLNSVSMGGFGGNALTLMDVGFISNNFSPYAPTTANRSANGGVVTFFFGPGVPPFNDLKPLSLRTDLTNWIGTMNVGFNATVIFPGADPFHPSGIAVVTTPEPSSILLLGSGALFALRRRRS